MLTLTLALALTLTLTRTLTLSRCASHETNDRYHFGRPGDAAFHDFAAHAEQLLRWNESGAIRIQVRL